MRKRRRNSSGAMPDAFFIEDLTETPQEGGKDIGLTLPPASSALTITAPADERPREGCGLGRRRSYEDGKKPRRSLRRGGGCYGSSVGTAKGMSVFGARKKRRHFEGRGLPNSASPVDAE